MARCVSDRDRGVLAPRREPLCVPTAGGPRSGRKRTHTHRLLLARTLRFQERPTDPLFDLRGTSSLWVTRRRTARSAPSWRTDLSLLEIERRCPMHALAWAENVEASPISRRYNMTATFPAPRRSLHLIVGARVSAGEMVRPESGCPDYLQPRHCTGEASHDRALRPSDIRRC